MGVYIIIGKVCSGKDYFARTKFPNAFKIDIGDIVREITKTTERVHNASLDEQIISEIFRKVLNGSPGCHDVVITGIRQLSIYKWIQQALTNPITFHLVAPLSVLKQRFEKRAHAKDKSISFEQTLERDATLGLAELEIYLEEHKLINKNINTIYTSMKTTLYKKSRAGKLQEWTIETQDNLFRTSEGYVGGAITPTAWTICEGKNVGRANATTPEEQAIKEAEARVEKQRDKGWADSLDAIAEAAPAVDPKLAHKYKDKLKHLAKWKVVALMPKLDGIRGLGTDDGEFLSRESNPITATPHIEEELKELKDGLSAGWNVDGELYNHDLKDDFNAISGMVRKKKLSEEDLALSKELMQYHIFDIVAPGNFASRYAAIKTLLEQGNYKYLKLVPCVFLSMDENFEAAAQAQYEAWLEEGYEGMMYQDADAEYRGGRTTDLLKRKEFVDGEYKLVRIEEGKGNRAGMAAKVYCVDERGEEFKAGVKGTTKYCKALLQNKGEAIGKMVTIVYQNLTPDRQVPRFGKMKAIRDYE